VGVYGGCSGDGLRGRGCELLINLLDGGVVR
jgi:hypothetical protein